MGEWTPTTPDVRNGYAHDPESEYRDPERYPFEVAANKRAFDRWLERERAQAVMDFALHVLPTEWCVRAREWAAVKHGRKDED